MSKHTQQEQIARIGAIARGASISDVYCPKWSADPVRQFRQDLQAILSLAGCTRETCFICGSETRRDRTGEDGIGPYCEKCWAQAEDRES